MQKRVFYSIPFLLLTLSLPLGTVSVGLVGGANIRIWELLLVLAVVTPIPLAYPGALAYFSRNMWGFAALFYATVLLSSANTISYLDIFVKQALLLLAMIGLFVVTSVQPLSIHYRAIARAIIYPGIAVSVWAIAELVYVPASLQTFYFDGLILPRARAYFAEANEYSQYLGVPFSFLVAALALDKGLRRPERIVFSLGVVVIVIAQLLSISRGGILAFAANLLAFACVVKYSGSARFFRWLKGRFFLAGVLIVAIMNFLFPEEFLIIKIIEERFDSVLAGNDSTTMIRLQSQLMGINYVTDSVPSLLFGIGFGNLPVLLGEGAATTANFLSDVFVEAGLFGVIFLLLALMNVVYLSRRDAQLLYSSQEIRPIFVGSYMALFGLLIGGLTYATHMLNIFWFACGLVAAFHIEARRLRRARQADA